MDTETIRSALLDLIRQGRLTIENGGLLLDGDPISAAIENEGEYREDGYSIDTSHGCRRHRAIDDFIAKLKKGDKFERQVAEEADIWFGFHPDHAPQLVADSDNEAREVAKAYSNSNILMRWLAPSDRDVAGDFRIRPDETHPSDNYWFMPEKHAIVYAADPKTEIADRWPQTHISNLKGRVANLKRQAGLDWQ